MGILSGISDFFGLDIGTTALRVVQLSGNQPTKAVFRYGKSPVDFRLVSRVDDDSFKKLANVIREALVQHQITTRNVVVGVPTRQVFLTINQFDKTEGDTLQKSLKFRVGNIVPGVAEQSKIDFAILDADLQKPDPQSTQEAGQPAPPPPDEKIDVLICSIEKIIIERQLEMLESINLNVLAFEPDALALTRTVANNESTINVLVDVGFRSTDVVVVARNEPRLILTVEFGTSHIVRQVINLLTIDEPTALDLIFRVGIKGDESHKRLTSAIIESLDLLTSNVHKALEFINSRYAQYQLGQVMLWGDIVYIPGLLDFLSTTFNAQVAVADTWQNVACPSAIQDNLQALTATFGVAAGLAERQDV